MSPRPVPFWERVDTSAGPESCWPWQGAIARLTGYGAYTADSKSYKAHRFAFIDAVGLIPVGLFVCHRCDNPPCCNPQHLFLGTAADNTADMFAKGRQMRGAGEKHSQAKLTWEVVRSIRASSDTGIHLAARHGVSRAMVSRIRQNHAWKELSL